MSGYYPEPPLFAAAAAARRTDPPTSHAAAARAPVIGDRARILNALSCYGPAGQTLLAERTGLTVAQVSKRLPELRRAGLVERDGETRSASGGREAKYRIAGAA